jgi:hypothetical protein
MVRTSAGDVQFSFSRGKTGFHHRANLKRAGETLFVQHISSFRFYKLVMIFGQLDESLGLISLYEIQYGAPARDTFSSILTIQTENLEQLPTDEGDIENALLFALAVKTSTGVMPCGRQTRFGRHSEANGGTGHRKAFACNDSSTAKRLPRGRYCGRCDP